MTNAYLQPLIHELKILSDGVEVYDAFGQEPFKLCVALRWTVNDLPA